MTAIYRPEGFTNVTPYFTVKDAPKFITFLEQAFDGEMLFCALRDDGSIANAPVRIGDAMVEVSESSNNFPATFMAIHLYVRNVDKTYEQALEAGADSVMPPENRKYGDRDCFVKDTFGNNWYIGTQLLVNKPKSQIQ